MEIYVIYVAVYQNLMNGVYQTVSDGLHWLSRQRQVSHMDDLSVSMFIYKYMPI